MRILIYSYNYHPEPIGIAPLMTELAEGLVKKGHQVRVVTGLPNYPERKIYPEYRGKFYVTETINGVIIQRCYVWVKPLPGLIGRILLDGSFVVTSIIQALNGWKPEVILLTVPPLPVSVPAALLGKIYGCPIILNLQDILPDAAVHVGLIKSQSLIKVFTQLEKFAYKTATKITVIAEGFRDNLLNKGIPDEKMTLIPNWVDINFIRPLPKQENNYFRKDHQLENKFVVLYSGNIALTQGLETVIKAAKLIDISDIVFVIVGEEKALNRLQEYCEELQVNNVKLLPFQPREKLPEMLAASDVGLVLQKSNVIAFNMPSKIQVLLASGRPIIASVPSTGTAGKAINRSQGGLVIPPEDEAALADAVLELYHHPEKCATLGEKAREFALQEYAFEQSLNKYEQLFNDVVKITNYP
jgi:colanic acid biosynthesis glycosyl transferase WcaI